MRLSIKRWGNGAGLALSKPVLKLMKCDVGDEVEVKMTDEGLLITPAVAPEYSLGELLATCPEGGTRLDDEDRAWLSASPVGKEV